MLNNMQLAKLHYDIIRDTDTTATPPTAWESLDTNTQNRHAQAVGAVRQQIAQGLKSQQDQREAAMKAEGQPTAVTVA